MEKVNIIVDSSIEKEVNGLLYLYNSKYYLIYTEGELDENEYVILYLVLLGRETINTETGVVDTGYMMGVLPEDNEWPEIQKSIATIVEDKKQGTQNPSIQYFPTNMLGKIKIIGQKRFRLTKNIIQEKFGLNLSIEKTMVNEINENENIVVDNKLVSTQNLDDLQMPINEPTPLVTIQNTPIVQNEIVENNNPINSQYDIIVDYRTSFFEEQEKNKQLQEKINELTAKLEDIKKVIE